MLADIAGVASIEVLALEQFTAKSDVSHIPNEKLILRDQKVFDMGDAAFSIAQIEVINADAVLERKEALQAALETFYKTQNFDQVLVMISDINSMNSTVICVGELTNDVCNALNGQKLTENSFFLEGVVSRKKQVIPYLQKKFG